MASTPVGNWLPKTVIDAVPPLSVAEPNAVLPRLKAIEPVGIELLPDARTVAVTCVLPFTPRLDGLAVTVVVVVLTWRLLHCVIRLFPSTEPHPVARSYPGPALKPRKPPTQSLVAATQGTTLPLEVMS